MRVSGRLAGVLLLAACAGSVAPGPPPPQRFEPGRTYYSEDCEIEGEVRDLGDEKNLEEVFQFYRYCEAVYDAERRELTFRQYLRGDVEWTERYTWDAQGRLVEKERTPAGGPAEVTRFDR